MVEGQSSHTECRKNYYYISTDPLNLVYSDQTLTELDNLKFLGLHIDSHFMWKFHRLTASLVEYCLLCC